MDAEQLREEVRSRYADSARAVMSRTVTGGARNFISVGSLDPASANTTGATTIARASSASLEGRTASRAASSDPACSV